MVLGKRLRVNTATVCVCVCIIICIRIKESFVIQIQNRVVNEMWLISTFAGFHHPKKSLKSAYTLFFSGEESWI